MTETRKLAADAYRRMVINRRLLLLALLLAGIGSEPGKAEQPEPSSEATLAKAVGVLAHEKSAAEQYAVILATAGKSDTALYVRGIQLYADAKAEFDAMIAELKFGGSSWNVLTALANALAGRSDRTNDEMSPSGPLRKLTPHLGAAAPRDVGLLGTSLCATLPHHWGHEWKKNIR